MKRILLAVLGLLLVLEPAAAADRPNIVLIMSDDIGIGGFSCYGADKYKTPRIDALANEVSALFGYNTVGGGFSFLLGNQEYRRAGDGS